MIAELGHLLAFLALGAAVGQSYFGITEAGEPARRLAIAGASFAALSMIALIISFVSLDFSVQLVAEHSHSQKPLLYRIAGAWGNHEGSMLLWCLTMAGYGAVAALGMREGRLRDRALGVQGLLTVFSFLYLLLDFDALDFSLFLLLQLLHSLLTLSFFLSLPFLFFLKLRHPLFPL